MPGRGVGPDRRRRRSCAALSEALGELVEDDPVAALDGGPEAGEQTASETELADGHVGLGEQQAERDGQLLVALTVGLEEVDGFVDAAELEQEIGEGRELGGVVDVDPGEGRLEEALGPGRVAGLVGAAREGESGAGGAELVGEAEEERLEEVFLAAVEVDLDEEVESLGIFGVELDCAQERIEQGLVVAASAMAAGELQVTGGGAGVTLEVRADLGLGGVEAVLGEQGGDDAEVELGQLGGGGLTEAEDLDGGFQFARREEAHGQGEQLLGPDVVARSGLVSPPEEGDGALASRRVVGHEASGPLRRGRRLRCWCSAIAAARRAWARVCGGWSVG